LGKITKSKNVQYRKTPNANLDHLIRSAPLLSLAEYQQAKVAKRPENSNPQNKAAIEFRDIHGEDVWRTFRKPEFQRATHYWNDDKIIDLLRSVINGYIIPGVILWYNHKTEQVFVLDGAHRLSVIRAWVTDDWGDSIKAKKRGFVEPSEINAAKRIRERVNTEIGSFAHCQNVGELYSELIDEDKLPKEHMSEQDFLLGKFIRNAPFTFQVPIQWVIGDYNVAEQSFIKINMGGQPLDDKQRKFIEFRRSPVIRAINGVATNGTNDAYWLDFKDECKLLSEQLYEILFSNSLTSNEDKSFQYLPFCVVRKQKTFDHIAFLQNIFTVSWKGITGESNITEYISRLADEGDEAVVANETKEALNKVCKMFSNIKGKEPQSMGIHPGVYFYTSAGEFRELYFLIFLSYFSYGNLQLIREKKLRFTKARDMFEEVWVQIKDIMLKEFSRKGAGPARITFEHIKYIENLLDVVEYCKLNDLNATDAITMYIDKLKVVNIDDIDVTHDGEQSKPFTKQVKLQRKFIDEFNSSTRCGICGGRVSFDSIQYDHIEQRSRGGGNSVANSRTTHPFCNRNRDLLEQEGIRIVVKEEIILPTTVSPDSTVAQLIFDF